ncbi:MAG TPA: carboxypeptidase-like regulatory domain-containing protein [Thermoanaerobaculia bacterium]|nr:carboxypeptidase-like regulatory domain-containing protein [Thermoanaerobaculia bacterium]
MRMKPSLKVDVRLTDAATLAIKGKSPQIRLVADGTRQAIAERTFDRAGVQTFPYMPSQLLDVEIVIGSWKIDERADLTSGDDVTTTIELTPIRVSGVVYYGTERAASKMQFRRSDAKLDLETNDAGEYEAFLWGGGSTVAEVWLRDRPDLPSHRELVHLTDGANDLDFRIPRTRYRISVTDSDSGKPIGGSTATLINRWNDPREGKRSASRTVMTNDAGIADLPPLYAGVVELHTQATGYFKAEAIHFNVAEGDEAEHTVNVQLRAEGNHRAVHVLLPSGAPASGARLISVHPETLGFLWRGQADADGVVEIPESLDQTLLLGRHPNAGVFVRRWHRADPSSAQLRFPASAAPLVMRFTRSDGSPARFAGVTLWIGDVVLREGALAFLFDAELSDTDGVWVAPGLPPGPVTIVAASRTSGNAAGQVLRAFATEIPFPWPGSVTVRAIE